MIPPNSFGNVPYDPLVGSGGKMTTVWDRFIRAIYARTGGQTGVPFQVNPQLQAAGSSISDAAQLTVDYHTVVAGSGNGVKLSNLQPGQTQTVVNLTGAALKVYPPDATHIIDALGGGTPYSIPSGKSQVFTAHTATQFHSLQLG